MIFAPYTMFLPLVLLASSAFGHVLPITFPGFMNHPISTAERVYIRIIPSPIMEGFANYELCPLIQDENQNLLVDDQDSEKNILGYYYHDLKNPECQRPYQINPQSDPVYFDMRDLEKVLNDDDTEKLLADVTAYTLSIAAFWATTATVPSALLGWSSGAAVGLGVSEVADQISRKILPIDEDHLKLSRIKYFTGVQAAGGSDLVWPILPADVPTFGECYSACKLKEVEECRIKSSGQLPTSPQSLVVTESISSMVDRFNPCLYECEGYPARRITMNDLWRILYLDTIYKAGQSSRNGQTPTAATDLSSSQLYEMYHVQKHFDESAWKTVTDANGREVRNHFTHKANMVHSRWNGTNRYPLCDYIRIQAYLDYQKKVGPMKFASWLEQDCHFDESVGCREYFKSLVQRGPEICTILSD